MPERGEHIKKTFKGNIMVIKCVPSRIIGLTLECCSGKTHFVGLYTIQVKDLVHLFTWSIVLELDKYKNRITNCVCVHKITQ